MLIGETWNQLTLFAGDTLVSPLASQGRETAPTMPAIFGRDSQTLLGFYDPDTHCWKTSQGTLVSDSVTCLQTWPRAGMTRNGIAYQLQPSAHRTCATEYSLSLHAQTWPTPTAHLAKEGGYPAEGNRNTQTLTYQVMWPTPTASSWGNEGSRNLIQQHVEQGDITEAEKRQMISGNGGKLNPTWVEWLMGFPTGWTDLEH